MNGTQTLDGFQFNDNPSLNMKVNSVAAFKLGFFVHNGHWFLPLYPQLSKLKFVRQTFFIGGFEQSRTEMLWTSIAAPIIS